MRIAIIGVPYDLDQRMQGMGAAPEVLLHAGLVERLQAAGHDVADPVLVEIDDSDAPAKERIGALQAALAGAVREARAGGAFALIIGGDCVAAVGAVSGLGGGDALGVIWFDAHGDFNTPETTISGYLGGMPLACVVGRGNEALREQAGLAEPVRESHVVIAGARDLDEAEELLLGETDVTLLRTTDLNDGLGGLDRALMRVSGVAGVYLHVDVDVLDPAYAPGVRYLVTNGLTPVQLQSALYLVARHVPLVALSITAVCPDRDIEGRTIRAALNAISAVLDTE